MMVVKTTDDDNEGAFDAVRDDKYIDDGDDGYNNGHDGVDDI